MTKTDWTAEEVLAIANLIKREFDSQDEEQEAVRMLRAYAKRIEADESAVPVGHFCEMSPGKWEQTRHEFAGLLGVTPLFTHPPTQPAQEQPGWKVSDAIVELSKCQQHGWSYSARAYRAGWNDCRTAMLAASPTPPKEN